MAPDNTGMNRGLPEKWLLMAICIIAGALYPLDVWAYLDLGVITYTVQTVFALLVTAGIVFFQRARKFWREFRRRNNKN